MVRRRGAKDASARRADSTAGGAIQGAMSGEADGDRGAASGIASDASTWPVSFKSSTTRAPRGSVGSGRWSRGASTTRRERGRLGDISEVDGVRRWGVGRAGDATVRDGSSMAETSEQGVRARALSASTRSGPRPQPGSRRATRATASNRRAGSGRDAASASGAVRRKAASADDPFGSLPRRAGDRASRGRPGIN